MHRIISTIFPLILIGSLNSQVSFYLRPSAQMKTNYGKFGNDKYMMANNGYFTFQNNGMYFTNFQLDLGIHAGIKFKNKHVFEIGWTGDNAGSSTSAIAHFPWIDPLTNIEYMLDGATRISQASSHLKLSLNYNAIIFKSKKETVQLRTNVGIGIFYNRYVNRKKGQFAIQYSSTFTLGELSPNVFMTSHEIKTINYWRMSPFLSAGLGVDFYTRKKKSLFSFDIFYVQGSRPIDIQEHTLTIMDNNNQINYLYRNFSRGSGFYFQISRNFQIYPWKKKTMKIE